jgi:riboflavin synthase
MFTGLVEFKGTVTAKEPGAASSRLSVEAGFVADDAKIGDSIAINGCCLTVIEIAGSRLTFDLLAETERKTNLQHIGPGASVNLERSLRVGDRLGGHFVTGHVEETARIIGWEKKGTDYELAIAFNPEFDCYVVPKGSIAIDGISLTVAEVESGRFTVWIIPHTREVTALSDRRVGDAVNLEFDLLAKYTAKIVKLSNLPRV